MGVGAEFGKNSAEYERAGGVRKSDRASALPAELPLPLVSATFHLSTPP